MIAESGSRSRWAGLLAGAGVFSLLLGTGTLGLAPASAGSVAVDNVVAPGQLAAPGGVAAPGAAAAPGNNGVIKIEGVDIDDPPNNNPHQGCTFTVEFYNYDEDPDYIAEVEFDDQAPTANGGLQVVSGDLTPFIGGDVFTVATTWTPRWSTR